MKAMKVFKFKNGIRVKHIKNRSVTLFKNALSKGGIIIEFAKADETKEDFGKPCAVTTLKKNKVQVTGIPISNEAAMGLYISLHDYFSRVLPAEIGTEPF